MDYKNFLNLIWYLHDIGKADNIHKILESKTINARTYTPVGVFFFLSNLLNIEIPQEYILGEKSDTINKNKIKLGKFSREVDSLIEQFYLSLGDKNIKKLVFSDYYKKMFEISLMAILDYVDFDKKIINPKNREKILSIIKNKFNDKSVNFDKLLYALIYFIDKLSFLTYKDVSSPHITYWMHFFALHKEFDYLNWVLFHHWNYPSIEEIEYYEMDKWLKKWADLIGYDFNKYYTKEDSYILPKNKDIYMAILTVVDLIDALLSKRSYQAEKEDLTVFKSMFDFVFTKEVSDYLMWLLIEETFSSPEEMFDKKILSIMDNVFKENLFYPKVRQVVLNNKNNIISLYKNLRDKNK